MKFQVDMNFGGYTIQPTTASLMHHSTLNNPNLIIHFWGNY